MTNIAIVIRNNNRNITRGCYYEQSMGHFVLQMMDGEVITPTIDYTDYLGAATISSVALTTDGVTASQTNTAGVMTLTVSGVDSTGDLKVLLTLSDGRKRLDHMRVINPRSGIASDYGMVRV